MNRYARALVALTILLSGLALVPHVSPLAGDVGWQRFQGAYEDLVVVTRAEWREDDDELRVRATTTAGGAAVLTVFETASGLPIGTLTFEGGNEHRGEFSWPHDPRVITVSSSMGGEATVLVTGDAPPTVTSTAPTETATAETTTTATSETPTPGDGTPTATGETPTPDDGTSTATSETPTPDDGTSTATSETPTPSSATPSATFPALPWRIHLPFAQR